jgi:EmrB/QacA subfamily drug resistance transporter
VIRPTVIGALRGPCCAGEVAGCACRAARRRLGSAGVIDSTIANLAGPSIRADLGGSETTLQWVLSAYTAVFAIGLITSGRLGDLMGRRRLFLAGMARFTLASLASGLAPDVGFLITARALQGLFGSVMIPQGFAMVKVVFAPDQLRKALIPFGPVVGLATVAGPILAGWLLHLDLFGSQWRLIFLINVPIGVVAWALGRWFLPHRTGEDSNARLDLGGVALLTLASALVIIPLIQGRELGWPLWTYLSMAGSLVALALFVVSERRSTHPVITPSLFGKRSFVIGLTIVAAFFGSLSGFQLAFNLLLQLGQHWTALHTSLTLIPMALGSAVAVVLAGAVLTRKLGRATLQLGLGIAVIDFVLGGASTKEVGTGAGMLNAVQQFSGAIGVAALGTVFFAQANHGGTAGFDAAAELVIGLAAVLYLITFALVWLLPKHAQQAEG